MDNYLASEQMSESSNFVVNFNFEFLQGCKFKCRGCYVNKEQNKIFTDLDEKNLNKLLSDLENKMYKPFIAFIGPVDFLTADNTEKMLKDPKVQRIFKFFKRLSFQTTYMNLKNYEAITKLLREQYSGYEIEVNIVLEPSKIVDNKYLETIEANKKKFIESLGRDDVRSFGIMNVYDYDQSKINDLLRNYEFMHKRVEHLFETTIDYNFSLGRKPNLSSNEFRAAAQRVKDLFNESVVSDKTAQYLRFSFGKLTDSLIEKQFNYLNGKIFYSPLLYERFVSFDIGFQIPIERFETEELEVFENQMISRQYSYVGKTKECETCVFLGSCVDRGVLFLMEHYDVPTCLVAKKALEIINNSGYSE